MRCKYKLNLEDEPIKIEFSNSLNLPENLVYLHINEDIKSVYFRRFKKLVNLKIENIKMKNLNLLYNTKLETLHIENVVLDDVKLIEKNILSLTLNFCIIFNKDIFKKFTNLSNLIVNNVDLFNINLLENKLDHLKLHRTNLNELKIYKDDLETLTLNRGYIKDINILKGYTNLGFLNIENVKFDSNVIIFPKINLEYLFISNIDNVEEINLNNLYNLKELNIKSIPLLKKLYINELKNLKELYVKYLEHLDVLNFEKSKLDLLDSNNVTNLKYIDGYTKTSEVEEAGKQLLKQKVLSRRRIYLLAESPLKGTRTG